MTPLPPDLQNTVSIIGGIWAVLLLAGSVIAWASIRRFERRSPTILVTISLGIMPLIGALIPAPLVYAVISIPYDQVWSFPFWKSEVTKGTLPLRIASIVILCQLVRSIFRFVPDRIKLMRRRKGRGLSEDDIADFTTSTTKEERSIWRKNDLMMLAAFQFSFYLVVLTTLWCCVISGTATPITAITSWALLFIVDDWTVIADYCYRFNCLPLTPHSIKVAVINAILLGAAPIALYPTGLYTVWMILSFSLVVLTLLVLIMYIHIYMRTERNVANDA